MSVNTIRFQVDNVNQILAGPNMVIMHSSENTVCDPNWKYTDAELLCKYLCNGWKNILIDY